MRSINALELPEITQIVAGYLSNLEPCLTVCKAWRSLYLPYYWREAEAGIQRAGETFTPFLIPTRNGQYRQFIRVLTVYNNFDSINQSLDYPSLRRLRLLYHGEEAWGRPEHENSALKDFVNQHSLLECLDVENIPSVIMNSTWTALVDHPRLEKVILECNSFLPDDFWRVCTRLRTLEFNHFDQSIQGCIPKDLMLPSIRRLSLIGLNNINVKDELDVIAACPLLEDLVWWRGGSYEDPMWATFGKLAAKGMWPLLQQLSIRSYAEDADLSHVIASMHQPRKIEIDDDSFGPLSFAALQRHASTLQRLSIPRAIDSRMIRDVLCTCARLEYLKAHRLDAKDIAEGGPWACTSLRSLSVKISFRSGEDSLQPVVFERISRLVLLEELDNRLYHISGGKPEHGLSFRLQSGMAALACLSRLRCVKLDSSIQAMDFNDALWIIDHWKRLELIRGRLNQNIFMREQVGVLFSMSGIELFANR